MESTTEWVLGAFAHYNEDRSFDVDDDDYIDPLSIEIERHVRIVLGTGGPHVEIDCVVNDDGDIQRAEFIALWGSDRRETTLSVDDPLWTYAEQMAQYVTQV